jgi:hypothetical protein
MTSGGGMLRSAPRVARACRLLRQYLYLCTTKARKLNVAFGAASRESLPASASVFVILYCESLPASASVFVRLYYESLPASASVFVLSLRSAPRVGRACRLLRQNLYFCTTKASKLSTLMLGSAPWRMRSSTARG